MVEISNVRFFFWRWLGITQLVEISLLVRRQQTVKFKKSFVVASTKTKNKDHINGQNRQIEAISRQTSMITCDIVHKNHIQRHKHKCLQIQKLQPFKNIDLTTALPGRVGYVEEVSLWSSGRGRRKRGRESSGGSGTNAARAIARETETRDEDVKGDENDGSGVQFFDHVDVLVNFLLHIIAGKVTSGG